MCKKKKKSEQIKISDQYIITEWSNWILSYYMCVCKSITTYKDNQCCFTPLINYHTIKTNCASLRALSDSPLSHHPSNIHQDASGTP